MKNSFIEIKGVMRIYRDTNWNEVYALKNINLNIEKGEFISFVGPSGCGKTTLLRLIAGLDKPQSGTLKAEGVIIESPSHERGYIFQAATLFPWNTVEENVAAGLKARGIYEQKKDLVQKYIDIIGLSGFEKSYPHEISGGMAQRAAIIRALINEPKVLLLDEPLGALDAFKRVELQDLLHRVWTKTQTTMVMVTHDVDEAIYLSTRIVIMTPRPGEIKKVIDVNLPNNQRNRNDNNFIEIRKVILNTLHLASSSSQDEPEYML
jgi:ABC-type nitrate/sulfonate/bicarbonate transport system ATPase subunit